MEDRGQKRSGMGIGEGIRTGLGVLGAFKDAIEETLQEAVDRGDLAPDRARQAMRDAAQRMQAAFDDTRGRLEFATRRDLEELRAELEVLRARLDRHEQGAGGTVGDTAPEGEPNTTPSGIIVTD